MLIFYTYNWFDLFKNLDYNKVNLKIGGRIYVRGPSI